MNKFTIFGVLVVVLLLGIVGYYLANQPASPGEGDAMMEDTMMEKDGDAMMEGDGDAMMQEEDAMMEEEDGAMMDDSGA